MLVPFETEEDAYAAHFDLLVDPVKSYGHLNLSGKISDICILEEGIV